MQFLNQKIKYQLNQYEIAIFNGKKEELYILVRHNTYFLSKSECYDALSAL